MLYLGNSFGCERDNICDVGLGKQETYRNCADIRIVSSTNDNPTVGQDQPIVPPTTTTTTTVAPNDPEINANTQPRQATTEKYAEAPTPQPNDDPVVNDDDGRTVLVAGTTLTCVGVAPFNEIQGIDVWCNNNCNSGNCPASICLCT